MINLTFALIIKIMLWLIEFNEVVIAVWKLLASLYDYSTHVKLFQIYLSGAVQQERVPEIALIGLQARYSRELITNAS
jgi:hypothetical protein